MPTAQHHVNNQQIEQLVKNHLTDQRWREVFLLVAGLMPGRKGADELLQGIEKKAQSLTRTPKLEALLRWAETATVGSERDGKPAAKRTLAIFLALALDLNLDLNLDLVHAHVSARAYAPDLDLDLALARVQARNLNLALARDLARDLGFACPSVLEYNLDLTRYLGLHPVLVLAFKEIIIIHFDELLKQLESLQSQIPDDNSHLEVRRAFVYRIQQLWFNALQLDPDLATLSEEETQALKDYLYANELMVRCKEAAVRVSPQVWAAIEGRMLTVMGDG